MSVVVKRFLIGFGVVFLLFRTKVHNLVKLTIAQITFFTSKHIVRRNGVNHCYFVLVFFTNQVSICKLNFFTQSVANIFFKFFSIFAIGV